MTGVLGKRSVGDTCWAVVCHEIIVVGSLDIGMIGNFCPSQSRWQEI